ncbi:Cell surface spherulin 4-like protein [Penicillium capsulatum]|uniref:Cell surface spherulin 4-like protein n=1 Tax=Penicillium capsulatum TaxID=69766 RepID=A0A9W9LSC5_9EURO|nr:Cell surface spherulin 4-like protein [Penicillium capsulatum]KAJ6135030.1 Cell surface spherulin 4-like protein [Penicillium capsulatum]
MRAASILMSLALTVAPVFAETAILLPLYTGTDKWPDVYKTIKSHSDISFHIIVNPNSGPGDDVYPDNDYFTGVEILNGYENVKLIGYVRTGYGGRDISEVNQDVASYSTWASKGTKNTTLDGIFFDEVPNANEDDQISYMQEVAKFAKSKDLSSVVFNPGTVLEPGSEHGYYKEATMIVEFENSAYKWGDFSPKSLSQNYRSSQAVIAYGVTSDDEYRSIVHDAQAEGLGAVYLTPGDDYMSPGTVSNVAAAFNS